MALAANPLSLPRLYAILDADLLASRHLDPAALAAVLYSAGVRCLQYRDKSSSAPALLAAARRIRDAVPRDAILILNDRADLAVLAGCDGVHLGQQDISPAGARRILGSRLIGLSTHNPAQLHAAALSPADYIAIGPVFATASKRNPDPVIGLDGVRLARSLIRRPLVAIGGITPANARSVIDAGADAVAVISALLPSASIDPNSASTDRTTTIARLAEDFLTLLL